MLGRFTQIIVRQLRLKQQKLTNHGVGHKEVKLWCIVMEVLGIQWCYNHINAVIHLFLFKQMLGRLCSSIISRTVHLFLFKQMLGRLCSSIISRTVSNTRILNKGFRGNIRIEFCDIFRAFYYNSRSKLLLELFWSFQEEIARWRISTSTVVTIVFVDVELPGTPKTCTFARGLPLRLDNDLNKQEVVHNWNPVIHPRQRCTFGNPWTASRQGLKRWGNKKPLTFYWLTVNR